MNDIVKKLFSQKCLLPGEIFPNNTKIFFVAKIFFEGMSVCRKIKDYPQGLIALISFYEGLLVTFSMSLFACLSFWAPTRFPEVIRPRYSPDNLKLEGFSYQGDLFGILN